MLSCSPTPPPPPLTRSRPHKRSGRLQSPGAARPENPFVAETQGIYKMSSSINVLNVNENLHLPAVPQAPQDLYPHREPLAAAEIPGTIKDDRQAAAARVRNLLGQANITEKRVAIGVEYKARRNELRRNSRHDADDRTGWYAEFAKPNPHPFSRRAAERHMDLVEAFRNVGPVWPMLPHPFGARHVLATFNLSKPQLNLKS